MAEWTREGRQLTADDAHSGALKRKLLSRDEEGKIWRASGFCLGSVPCMLGPSAVLVRILSEHFLTLVREKNFFASPAPGEHCGCAIHMLFYGRESLTLHATTSCLDPEKEVDAFDRLRCRGGTNECI